jgi:hypothetical protein
MSILISSESAVQGARAQRLAACRVSSCASYGSSRRKWDITGRRCGTLTQRSMTRVVRCPGRPRAMVWVTDLDIDGSGNSASTFPEMIFPRIRKLHTTP